MGIAKVLRSHFKTPWKLLKHMIKPERLEMAHLAGGLSPLFSRDIFRLFPLESESSCQGLSFQQATEGFEMASSGAG